MEVLTTSVKRTATKRKNMFGFGTPKALSPRQTTAAHGGIASHARKPSKRSASSASSEIKGSYRGYSIARDEAGEYYSSLDSGSRFETLAAVKKHIDWYLKARGNPAKFDRCVKAVKAKGGAYDPYAVCTAAGTRNPSSLYPDGSFVKAQFQERGYSELLWVKIDRANDATRKIAGTVDNQPVFLRKIKLGSKVKLRYNDVIDRMNPARRKRGNPAAAAAEAFTEFHGHEPDELVTIQKKVHFHKHLSGAGELRALVVKPIGYGLPNRTLKGFKKALLAFNEAKNQLYVEGGDQALSAEELQNFGIRETHETEVLGKIVAVDYFTTKDHLGDEGGTAVYGHQFRTTNENGQHVVVTIAQYPTLIYRVLDEQLEFAGGSYTIRAAGIDQ